MRSENYNQSSDVVRQRREGSRVSSVDMSQLKTGFTIIELMSVIVIIGALALFLLPALARPKRHFVINCASHLKQVGLAFRIWEVDYGNRYPMSVYTNVHGEPLYANAQEAFRYFQVMSNEINNPKMLLCVEDKQRRAATNFTTDFDRTHISYFIGLDADDSHPQRFLAGDSNLTNGTKMVDGVLTLTTNHPTSWTKARHRGEGNVAMADGSVQQLDSITLKKAVENTGITTNRLLMP